MERRHVLFERVQSTYAFSSSAVLHLQRLSKKSGGRDDTKSKLGFTRKKVSLSDARSDLTCIYSGPH